jgi:hypothetical protein
MPTESFVIAAAQRPPRWIHAIEAGTFFLFLLLYIWYFQARYRLSWVVLLAMLIASQLVHGERPRTLGVRWEGFAECVRRYGLSILATAVAGVLIGVALDTVRPVPPGRVLAVLLGYTWWALVQQYLLNGFFVTRLSAAFDERRQFLVAPLAGMLFAAAHVPNVVLVEVTLVTGVLAAFIYRRYRNLLFLAVAHALIGTTLWLVVPDSVSHHLRVGPGMSRHRHRSVPPTDVRSRPDVRGGLSVSDRRADAREPVSG